MISAVAMVTVSNETKKAQMLRPNSTPAMAVRLKSWRFGHRLVSATITNSTLEAIHSLQNDSTTPEAWVDLPSTPPNDQHVAATSTAGTPPRRDDCARGAEVDRKRCLVLTRAR
jgi:hypothetical protein